MIAFIKGKIIQINDKSIIVLNNNIGWEIFSININEYHLEEDASFFLYMHIREDDISMFGFRDNDQLNIFKLLISVSGVGPRIALTLLEERGIQKIVYSIDNNVHEDLRVSGVGVKTAQKIVIELKNKVSKFAHISGGLNINNVNNIINDKRFKEAIEALKTLGYKESDILNSTANFEIKEEYTTEDIIRILLTKV